MQLLTPELIWSKKILLRYDIDVPIIQGKVIDDFRLKAGLQTLKFCLQFGSEVIILGHLGRPEGVENKDLSVAPIYDWFQQNGFAQDLTSGKLKLLENLRFEKGEESSDPQYAQELASFGEVFVNESFAAYHPASSTTLLPNLLPHAAGFHFSQEVERLQKLRFSPDKPYIVIMGGAKIEDKLPVVRMMAQIADFVLVGGKLPVEITQQGIELPSNVKIGQLNSETTDITEETLGQWQGVISSAKTILWNGPMGKVEESSGQTKHLAELIIHSGAETIVGGGDTVGALDQWGFINQFSFVSTGGGAMLEYLVQGTLPSIEVLR